MLFLLYFFSITYWIFNFWTSVSTHWHFRHSKIIKCQFLNHLIAWQTGCGTQRWLCVHLRSRRHRVPSHLRVLGSQTLQLCTSVTHALLGPLCVGKQFIFIPNQCDSSQMSVVRSFSRSVGRSVGRSVESRTVVLLKHLFSSITNNKQCKIIIIVQIRYKDIVSLLVQNKIKLRWNYIN